MKTEIEEWQLIFRFPIFGMSGVRRLRRIRGHLTDKNGISATIKMGITPKWLQKGYFWKFKEILRYFSRRKLKNLSETCKTGSITVLKTRSEGYKYRQFFGIKSVRPLALRQRRRRRQTCFRELCAVFCYSSTFFVNPSYLFKLLKR